MKGKLTISNPSGYEKEYMEITIKDSSSNVEFVSLKMSYADFMKALRGQAEVEGDLKVRKLDIVGMEKESKPLVFMVPKEHVFNRKEWAEANYLKYVKDGWLADKYFGSKSSFFKDESGDTYARTYQHRY